jgi:hypothetical protein
MHVQAKWVSLEHRVANTSSDHPYYARGLPEMADEGEGYATVVVGVIVLVGVEQTIRRPFAYAA